MAERHRCSSTGSAARRCGGAERLRAASARAVRVSTLRFVGQQRESRVRTCTRSGAPCTANPRASTRVGTAAAAAAGASGAARATPDTNWRHSAKQAPDAVLSGGTAACARAAALATPLPGVRAAQLAAHAGPLRALCASRRPHAAHAARPAIGRAGGLR
jgi:hypothetical protein